MKKRVVVTGIGMVTPLGIQIDKVWERIIKGESGVDYITLFDAATFPTKFASEVKNDDFSTICSEIGDANHMGRNTVFAIKAAKTAYEDAGISEVDSQRLGVYLGCGEGPIDFANFTNALAGAYREEKIDSARYIVDGMDLFHPITEIEQEPDTSSLYIAKMFNAQGPNSNCLTACAASAQAIGEAVEVIRRGDADVVISGGAHSMIHPLGLTGFSLLTALSRRNDDPKGASRPFDVTRDGFVLGEGAGMLILEEESHALKRGAKIYGEIAGYGNTSDAFRVTDMHNEGRGAVASMRLALEDAELGTGDVGYINAHGTSTTENDMVETKAIKALFGDHAYKVPISSTKSVLGHLIAATGVVESICCLMAIRNSLLPPTINYKHKDPFCDLDYVPNEARAKKIDVVLSNSFGFGGQNTSLVIKRYGN